MPYRFKTLLPPACLSSTDVEDAFSGTFQVCVHQKTHLASFPRGNHEADRNNVKFLKYGYPVRKVYSRYVSLNIVYVYRLNIRGSAVRRCWNCDFAGANFIQNSLSSGQIKVETDNLPVVIDSRLYRAFIHFFDV